MLAIWSALEPGVGIICGCLITLRPLFYYSDMDEYSDVEPTLNRGTLPSIIWPKKREGLKKISQGNQNQRANQSVRGNQNQRGKPERLIREKEQEIVCETCQGHSKTSGTTALPEAPLPQNSKDSVYLKRSRIKLPRPNRRGKIFSPNRSKEQESGFGLKLFGSSFGDSVAGSSISKSASSRAKKSGQTEKNRNSKEKHLHNRYEQWALRFKQKEKEIPESAYIKTELPETSLQQYTEAVPHMASRWTQKQYSRTSTNRQDQSVQPVNTSSISESPWATQLERIVQIRSEPSRQPLQNKLPFVNLQERSKSNTPTRSISEASKARPQRSSNSKEPGLPLDVFIQQSKSNSPTGSMAEASVAHPSRNTKSKEPSLPLDVFGL
jgi:hypothetical protein